MPKFKGTSKRKKSTVKTVKKVRYDRAFVSTSDREVQALVVKNDRCPVVALRRFVPESFIYRLAAFQRISVVNDRPTNGRLGET